MLIWYYFHYICFMIYREGAQRDRVHFGEGTKWNIINMYTA